MVGNEMNSPPARTQSVQRALSLLSLIVDGHEDRSGSTLSQLAIASGLSKSTAHRLLAELVQSGYVKQTHDNRYILGSQSYRMGSTVGGRQDLQQQVVRSIERLAQISKDSAFVSLRRGNHSVCLYRVDGTIPSRWRASKVGDMYPLGVGSHGLAMLAALPPMEAMTVVGANKSEIAQKFPSMSVNEILQRSESIRKNGGIAVNEGTVFPGSWAIGVAVTDISGGPQLALSIASSSARLRPKRQIDLASNLKEEASHLALLLRYA
ncbi:IclR family transcriptional regulator [Nocardia carnea]|uniref:IclR family transcriptional regulator n=1 Tax=Nocardia carnea TaxID=37328 RepID=UPI002456F857|nr:IclR family transcriptional regulator [Nocardia carnea]